ncbi:MAG: T9SS type A sorting domain-containing protein [Bacteroidetes bacterium]|nr:T9SS type A sorting domain-containing protein [Bacteroidota bacterium]
MKRKFLLLSTLVGLFAFAANAQLKLNAPNGVNFSKMGKPYIITATQSMGAGKITSLAFFSWDTTSQKWDTSGKGTLNYTTGSIPDNFVGYGLANGKQKDKSIGTGIKKETSGRSINGVLNIAGVNFMATTEVHQNKVSGVWTDSSKVLRTLNAKDQVTEELTQMWSGSAWLDDKKISYNYDSKGNYEGAKTEIKVGSNWAVKSQDKNVYTYNGSGNVSGAQVTHWDSAANKFIVDEQHTYYYTSGKISDAVIVSNTQGAVDSFAGISWKVFDATQVNPVLAIFDLTSYFSNSAMLVGGGKYISYVDYLYDSTSSQWLQNRRITRTYTTDTLKNVETTEQWAGVKYIDLFVDSSTYHADKSLKREAVYVLYPKATFIMAVKWNKTFNANKDVVTSELQIQQAKRLQNIFKVAYGYSTVSIEEILKTNGMATYPNPVSNLLNIQFNNPTKSGVIRVQDITGKVVLSYNIIGGENFFSVDVSSLPKGMYLLNYSTAETTVSTKIIKQ